jgi:MoaA/NifB/PqqE/SkfB family radical SAM enzyme
MNPVKMLRYTAAKGKKDLRFITLFVTDRCQLRCRHCFNYASATQIERELTCSEYEKIACSIGKFEILLISGGEPYLKKDLFEIIDIFKKISQVKFISIASNGFDSRDIIDRTAGYLSRDKCPLAVNLSIDGMKDTHNLIRNNTYSFDNCLVTLQGLWELKKRYPHFYPGVNLVLMDMNSREIEKALEYLRDRYRGINIAVELLRPAGRDKGLGLPERGVIHKIHQKVLANNSGTQKTGLKEKLISFIELSRQNYAFRIQQRVLCGENFPVSCLAGRTNAVIGAGGEVSFCEPLQAIGNLRDSDYNFRDIWNCGKARRLRGKIKAEKCSCTHCVNINSSIDYNLWASLVKAPLAGIAARR